MVLSLFSSHRKNCFVARCEYLHLIKKNSQQANKHCEFFLIRCKHSQRAAKQFLRWLEKRLYPGKRLYVIVLLLLLLLLSTKISNINPTQRNNWIVRMRERENERTREREHTDFFPRHSTAECLQSWLMGVPGRR